MQTFEQSKFSKISNLIFLTSTTFIISFIWINFYIRNFKQSIISATIISSCFFICYCVFKSYQKKIYISNHKKNISLQSLKDFLLYSNNTSIYSFICQLYNYKKLSKCESTNHYISKEEKIDIFLVFDKEIIDNENIIPIYKTRIYNNIIIFCIDNIKFTQIENTNIKIINLNELNKKTNEQSINLPHTIQLQKTPKFKAKDILCIILNKNKSRKYFSWGIILIFFSLFNPYFIYYNIISSILLLLSLYSRFNKQFN